VQYNKYSAISSNAIIVTIVSREYCAASACYIPFGRVRVRCVRRNRSVVLLPFSKKSPAATRRFTCFGCDSCAAQRPYVVCKHDWNASDIFALAKKMTEIDGEFRIPRQTRLEDGTYCSRGRPLGLRDTFQTLARCVLKEVLNFWWSWIKIGWGWSWRSWWHGVLSEDGKMK